jgi:hypothetical protein
VNTSFSLGVLLRIEIPGAKIDAGIKASEAFLAPLISTSPQSFFPPFMTNLSILK